jgi:hypothetical protein
VLLNCGVCRTLSRPFLDKQARRALAVLERSADEPISHDELLEAHNWANSSVAQCPPADQSAYFARCAVHNLTIPVWRTFNESGNLLRAIEESGAVKGQLKDDATAIVRDIFGNPFREVELDPRWQTTSTLAMASAMYDSQDFAAMSILADALEEAGCDNAEVLAHCRGDGPHVRGCWVVDLLLGKK